MQSRILSFRLWFISGLDSAACVESFTLTCIRTESCRHGEKWNDAQWNVEQLPQGIVEWTKDRFKRLDYDDSSLDRFINLLTACLCDLCGAPHVKCNLLAYLEAVAADEFSAQALVNTQLTHILVHLLEDEVVMLRMYAAAVLGVLIRFAATIETHLFLPGGRSHVVTTA
jgi:hypothetical protein